VVGQEEAVTVAMASAGVLQSIANTKEAEAVVSFYHGFYWSIFIAHYPHHLPV
jgi:hypothetical protein